MEGKRIGVLKRGETVSVELKIEDGVLTVTAYEYDRQGYSQMEMVGWNRCHYQASDFESLTVKSKELDTIRHLGERWHLNHLRAGCEHQRAEGWGKRPIDPSKPTNVYGRHHPNQRTDSWNMLAWVYPAEVPGGLLMEPCPVCGHKYGSGWLMEPLPESVVAFVERFNSNSGPSAHERLPGEFRDG